MSLDTLKNKLIENGFKVSIFETKAEAADYLDGAINNRTVGSGGSASLYELGILPRLAEHNVVYTQMEELSWNQKAKLSANADVYLMSANAIAEDGGEILSMDAVGNRVASSLFGHEKVYFVAGKNKISPDFHKALFRLRNVVAPKRAQRLKRKTPCAVKGDRCYNCSSPDRICNGLVVHYKKVDSMEMEVVLINEQVGY